MKKKTRHVLARLPDYLAGSLDPESRLEIQRHLESCRACQGEYAALQRVWLDLGMLPKEIPSPQLREMFYAHLESWKSAQAPATISGQRRTGRLSLLIEHLRPKQPAVQFATALVCLLVGYVIGVSVDSRTDSRDEVAQLRSEMMNMQRLVMLSLLKTESASERIRGASWTERVSRPDHEVFSQLFETLNYDPVVNVRLAALEALSKFYDEAEVKQGLIGSLARQTSPLMQLALAQVISSIHDAEGVAALKELLKNKELNKTVRAQVEKRIKEMES